MNEAHAPTLDASLEDGHSIKEEPEHTHNNALQWTVKPKWVSPNVIAFSSNRDVYPAGYASSIWTMNIETGEVHKLIDASGTNDELHVFYADEESIIAWGGMTRNVYRYEFKDGAITTYPINGVPFSVSNNGDVLLYKQVDDSATQLPSISILDLANGNVSMVDHLSDHQIYNGAWDDSNRFYAFYSRSFRELGARLFVFDVVNEAIQELQTSKASGLIDPNGSISWLDNQHLIISAEHGSWKISNGRGE